MRGARPLAVLLAAGALPACAEPPGPIAGIEEASGVTKIDGELLIVGDHEPGTYYRVRLDGLAPPRIRLEPERLSRHSVACAPYAADLEAIRRLPDGRIVVLSERLFSLLDREGIVAAYDHSLSEFGGRGLEGLAVRPLDDGRARIAVLWEGGYPDPVRLPAPVAETVRRHALRPVVVIHDLDPGASEVRVEGPEILARFELRVPLPPGEEPFAQRFRAPDLVWHRLDGDGWGLIVLISSGYGERPRSGGRAECPERSARGEPLQYCHKWLQRFTLDGEPFGAPFDLAATLPPEIRHSNWEGMGWYERGESLVFVYDERLSRKAIHPQEAFVLPLPDGW